MFKYNYIKAIQKVTHVLKQNTCLMKVYYSHCSSVGTYHSNERSYKFHPCKNLLPVTSAIYSLSKFSVIIKALRYKKVVITWSEVRAALWDVQKSPTRSPVRAPGFD